KWCFRVCYRGICYRRCRG
nr:Chain A, Tachyplesin-1 [Tachypleus tridentatus]